MSFNMLFQILNGAVILVGIPIIINTVVGIGQRLQKLDSLDEFVRKDMYPDLKNLKERASFLEGRLASPKEN